VTAVQVLFTTAQAFFTAGLAAVFLKEKLRAHNAAGMIVAALGLAAFALPAAGAATSGAATAGTAASISLPLIAMLLMAGLGWAGANIAARKMPGTGSLSLMVWSSLASPIPLAALSLAFEGPRSIAAAFSRPSLLTIAALAYLVLFSTLLGYGRWNRLIMRYGAGKVAPFSLMVPVFSLASASLVLGESFGPRAAIGAVLILAGLLIHVFGGRLGVGRRERL